MGDTFTQSSNLTNWINFINWAKIESKEREN